MYLYKGEAEYSLIAVKGFKRNQESSFTEHKFSFHASKHFQV